MSIYKKYIKGLRKDVQTYYSLYQSAQGEITQAEKALENAVDLERSTRAKNRSRIDIEIAAQNTKIARLNLQKKQDELKMVKDDRWSLREKMQETRKALSAELDTVYAVNPDEVDNNAMTLINSGIMNTADFERMYQKAKESGNLTMTRLIGKSAYDYAEKAPDDSSRRTLNAIFADSVSWKQDEMASFDECVFSLKRATGNNNSIYQYEGNPAMFEVFLESTADIEESED